MFNNTFLPFIFYHFHIIDLRLDGFTDTVDTVTVMDYLLRLLRYISSCTQQIMDDALALLHRNFASDVTSLLALLLEKKSILILKPHHFYGKDEVFTKKTLL